MRSGSLYNHQARTDLERSSVPSIFLHVLFQTTWEDEKEFLERPLNRAPTRAWPAQWFPKAVERATETEALDG